MQILYKIGFVFLLTSSLSCFSQTQDSILMNKIEFTNIITEETRTEAFEILVKSLKVNGDFGVYGNLSIGIEEILKDNYISLTNAKKTLNVSIAPRSQSGHDFTFQINKGNLEITDLVVGEVIPPPGS
jgi:hypothetical protein